MEKKRILITGATSGIGAATARCLGLLGHPLVLCGRRQQRLEALAQELSSTTQVFTLGFDISKRQEVVAAISSLPSAWSAIDVLINNAGNAHGLDLIHEGQIEDWEAMIDINIKGLLYLTRQVVPGMVARGRGHIINIGSIAGREPYPGGNVYGATKAAVDLLTQGMRMDLLDKGIKVSAIHPGLVETEFSLVRFKGDSEKARRVYEGYQPLRPEDVADLIRYMVEAPEHVNLADVLLLPKAQAAVRMVHKTT
ncbi:MAG: SDR family NAD(P)-dependent oxidoreductase [Flavobacteriales bacterium]|nr:SDR family NAD(P)-dependent oxidoreductase [Flavobacteriales bacterium]MDW8432684.1 SDR family NAD(P)-dependent oxidoreductase [Flavobacteriales bacterium]